MHDTDSLDLWGKVRSVFDVSKGWNHYGPGGGYHHFVGRCATYAPICLLINVKFTITPFSLCPQCMNRNSSRFCVRCHFRMSSHS